MSSLIVLTRNREMQRAEEIRATTAAGTVSQDCQTPEVGHPGLFENESNNISDFSVLDFWVESSVGSFLGYRLAAWTGQVCMKAVKKAAGRVAWEPDPSGRWGSDRICAIQPRILAYNQSGTQRGFADRKLLWLPYGGFHKWGYP